MTKFLILHGTEGSPDSNWFIWLKNALLEQGHHVWLPQLPGSDKPNIETYNQLLLSNSDFTYDKDTVVIGHSSGAVAALHLIQHLPNQASMKALILVSAFKDDLGWKALSGLFTEFLDFELVKQRCQSITFVHSNNDPYCPLEHAQYLADRLSGKLIVIKEQGHFNTELGPQYKQFPQILEIVRSVI